jgi:uncharacterized protein (TIGR02231 family)
MKKLLIISLSLFATSLCFANDKTGNPAVKATLTEATVYTSGVQLRSKLSYNAIKGLNEIIIEGISPSIDPHTIQVSATGDVVILDSKHSLFYPKTEKKDIDSESAKMNAKKHVLLDSIEALEFEIRDIEEQTAVFNEAKKIIKNNGLVTNHGRVNDSLALLKDVIAMYTSEMNLLNKKLISLSKSKKIKHKLLNQMNKRLRHLNGRLSGLGQGEIAPIPIHRITVSLIAESTTGGKINFSYLSSNAGWTPLYDIRSESSKGSIYMNYKAEIHQKTGLDWKNIKLSISTNNPYANKTKPELNPLYLGYIEYKQEARSNKNVYRLSEAPAEAISNRGYSFDSSVQDNEALDANEFTKVTHHLIAAEFKIDLPYNIKSNGETHMVLVQQSELQTNFKYYAVPKIDASVYLVAEMLKIDKLQLIPSKANIFFDGSYIGETYIDPTKMNDTLYLSLGKDPNISIKRNLLTSKCKEKTIGDKIEKSLAYSIEIKNMKSTAIQVVIQDQIPITTNTDIAIDKINVGKGKVKARTGLIEWNIKLEPKAHKNFDFEYRIKFNKNRQLNI